MSLGVSEDDALKQRLRGIYVVDEKNSNREVGVWFANPDVETRSQSYPYMTVELIDYTRASYRQQSGIIVDNDTQGTVAPVNGKAYTYEVPIPWDLTYQITAYSRHPRHDRTITAYILNNVFIGQHGYLAVTNDLGTETGYRHMILQEFTKRDFIENGRRLFRTIFTVTVSSEGTAYSPSSTTEVATVLINSSTTSIPTGKQPI